MNSSILNNAVETLKNDLGASLLATDIWVLGTGQSIAGHNSNPKAAALFDQIVANIQRALKVADYKKMTDYLFLSLENNINVIVILVEDKGWGMAVDGNQTPLGLLLNVALPNAIEAIKKKE